jgi:hypothetical protein
MRRRPIPCHLRRPQPDQQYSDSRLDVVDDASLFTVPALDPNLVTSTGSDWNAEHLGTSWDPADRVNTSGSADWIGVRIQYQNNWITDFLWWNGTIDLEDAAVFRIEPPAPS